MGADGEGTTIYSWDSGTETGGTAAGSADGLVGARNANNTTIKLDGKADFSTNTVTITLDKALSAGDKISVTAYRNKNAVDKTSGFKAKFEKGESTVANSTGLEFVNIDASDASAEDSNRGTEPNTCTFEVPTDAAGSKTITMTRSHQGTNLFITKIVITTPASGDEGGSGSGEGEVSFPITATWSFTDADVVAAAVAISGTSNSTQIENNGLKLTVEANGKTIRDNGNSIQTGDGVVFKVPVQGKKDEVTVVGYSSPYFAYSIAGVDATEATTKYTATAADVAQGYVEVVNKGQYLISISVTQNEDDNADEGGDTPATDVTATWDFVKNCANLAPKAEGGTYTATTMASDVESIEMTIVYNGGQIKNNDNSYYVGTGVEMQIPVKNVGDEVTVVGYPGYFHYSIAGVEAENQTTTYKAKATDVSQGYVAVVATASNNYINSISVTQYAPKAENIVEKSIYKTDFSDWTKADPSDPATTVTKTTKYTKQDLVFTLFQTSVMATEDTKFSAYTTLPRMTVRAEKEKGSYFTTSALAEITKIRFIHGATGSNRGWKVEAKGDGDADWVVVSSDAANPQNWCEVTKSINKKNCQLRFTNLADKQNAFLFELEIFGNVDLAGEPLLGSFKANGEAYAAEDIFEMNSAGNYEGTIEVSKTAEMISESNPLTDINADNGEIGTVTYTTTGEGADQKTVVTIPVTAEKGTVNYILTVVKKPDFTLTYYDLAGKEIGTQKVEKDAKIGKFEVNIDEVKAATEGYKARGWFKNNYVGEKYSVDDVITGDTKLYSVETEIEVSSDSRKYEFDLRSKTFYAEDHEAFNVISEKAKWHDGTHGWSFYNGDKIELLVGKKATISVALCQYGSGTNILVKNAAGETLETLAAKSETDGALVSYNYEGVAGTLTLEMEAGGEMYIHSVKIFNTTTTNYDMAGQWIYVKQGDASSFIDAIDAANEI